MESDSELFSLACTNSEDSDLVEKGKCERDFSDQEVGINCLIQIILPNNSLKLLINFTKFSGYLGLLVENYIWEHLQSLLISRM